MVTDKRENRAGKAIRRSIFTATPGKGAGGGKKKKKVNGKVFHGLQYQGGKTLKERRTNGLQAREGAN